MRRQMCVERQTTTRSPRSRPSSLCVINQVSCVPTSPFSFVDSPPPHRRSESSSAIERRATKRAIPLDSALLKHTCSSALLLFVSFVNLLFAEASTQGCARGVRIILDVLYRNSKPRKSRTPVTLFLLCCVSSSPDRPISFLSAFFFFFFFSLPFFCWRGRSCKKLNNKSYMI